MPTPNYSDPWLIQLLQSMQQRITNLEQAFQGVKDANGITRIKTGLLPNGDYGIALTDPLGNTQELLPSVFAFHAGVLSVTTTAFSAPAGSPQVTAWIGAKGDALITMSANIVITNVNDTGTVGLSIDGGAALAILENSSTASITGTSCSLKFSVQELLNATLSPGAHTFQMQFVGSTNGHTFNFGGTSIVVEPI